MTEPRGRRRRGARRRPPQRSVTVGDVIRGTVRLFGELLITAGVVMLFFAAYQIYGKQLETNREQEQLVQAFEEGSGDGGEADTTEAEALPGEAHSRMYVPSLDQDWVVVEGVSQADIEYGPGHYPGSADPGEEGNYAVAGHRVPAVFWDLDQLASGDEIVLEDEDSFYTYEVTQNHVVMPDQTDVVEANPDDPGAEPDRALVTLTTCHPKFSNAERLIVHAELAEEHDKSDGVPASIESMVD
ncbi:class E sortase [Lipingzhangella sp. LS1_29]|uniref:Class E sortase n=1 Tax=Lipingzhangella rawalii TaxID=2055835 RepID=A0ABU2H6P8_9ACTN|nr:class E sortase [Lipingzhangella rawalii]MDS1270500.1 class E sortase [Lipingzhangella rawalii]